MDAKKTRKRHAPAPRARVPMKLPTDPVRLTPEVMRGIRMALGLTTTELAEVLGVGRVALSMWENARAQPTRKVEAKYDIVIAVARELGLVT